MAHVIEMMSRTQKAAQIQFYLSIWFIYLFHNNKNDKIEVTYGNIILMFNFF